MAFFIGQDVICIRNRQWVCHCCNKPGDGPAYNQVLKITGIIEDNFLIFAEFPDGEYHKVEFRPVSKTDISLFIGMLTPKKVKEDA